MTKLSKVTGNSHDVFTKHLLLNDSLDDEKTLWKSIKPFLIDYENEDNACIIIDDIFMHKPWSKVNDVVCWHYDHVSQKMQKSIYQYPAIKALYPTKKTTIPNKEHYKYPYLLKEFKNDRNQVIIDTPNKVWSTDITYLKLEKGHVYLAAIIDWNTKKILSWKLSNTMDVSLTTSVLNEALSLYPKPDIVNTDQGSQYTASAHVDILKKHNIQISMDGKGRSIDNIVIERFWPSLKYEEIYLNDYKSMGELRYSIDNYINKYNTRRLHPAIGNKTPNEVYFKAINNLNNKLLLKVS